MESALAQNPNDVEARREARGLNRGGHKVRTILDGLIKALAKSDTFDDVEDISGLLGAGEKLVG